MKTGEEHKDHRKSDLGTLSGNRTEICCDLREGWPAAAKSGSIANAIGKNMSDEDLKAELDRLRKENEALKKGASSGIRMKVSEKGAVSIYGMGRFPVTLYKEQWLRLLDMSADIRVFIAANEVQLKTKD
jgi:hypothetical protein